MINPSFRSSTAARMAGMPVATLRIWEQRYQAVRPATAASGHRLYSAADVERLVMLRQLTEQGHTIGLLAGLDMAQLNSVARTQRAEASVSPMDVTAASAPVALRVVVVGRALACRLQRLADRQSPGLLLQRVGVFDRLEDAVQAAKSAAQTVAEGGVDVLLWQAGSLQPGTAAMLYQAQNAWCARLAAVVYRFSSAAGRAELTNNGAILLQEPSDDVLLGQWLVSLQPNRAQTHLASQAAASASPGAMHLINQAATSPRFDDAALAQFAGLSSTLACECPHHVAELLMQISSFETYSGECANKNAADAQLHAHLQRVAGAARMLFEAALERVAVAEGLPLPRSLADDAVSPQPELVQASFSSVL